MKDLSLADLLPHELLIAVISLTSPTCTIPATCRATQAASDALLIQHAWRNRTLLGPGGIPLGDDWFTLQQGHHESRYHGSPQATTSHLLFLLRSRLAGADDIPYAGAPAPASPPPDWLVPLNYVKYLFSRSGPFLPQLLNAAGPAGFASFIDAALEHLWQQSTQLVAPLREGYQAPASQIEPQMGALASADKEIDSSCFVWWQAIPDAFVIIIYLIRAGQLDSLHHALSQLAMHIPNIASLNARVLCWGILFLDNRQDARWWLNEYYVYPSKRATCISFGHFMTILALLEWSLPTLDIILSTLSIPPESITALVSSPGRSDTLQSSMCSLLKHISDPSRVFQMLDWFDSIGTSLTRFPLCASAHNFQVFSRLMLERDLPRMALQPEPERARSKLCSAVLDFICYAPNGEALVDMAIERKLYHINVWAKAAALSETHGTRPEMFRALLKLTSGRRNDIVTRAIMITLRDEFTPSSTPPPTCAHLFDFLVTLGIDPIDYIVNHSLLWNPERLDKCMQTNLKLPWHRPTALTCALDRLISDARSASNQDARHLANIKTLGHRAHIIRRIFGLCLNMCSTVLAHSGGDTRPAPSLMPRWLLDMNHQQLAILIQALIVTHNEMNRANPLGLPPAGLALDVLRCAWTRTAAPVTLSAMLPLPFACHLFSWTREWTSGEKYATYAPNSDEDRGFRYLLDVLVELDPDFVLAAANPDNVSGEIRSKFDEVEVAVAEWSFKCYWEVEVSADTIRAEWPVGKLKQGWSSFMRLMAMRQRFEGAVDEEGVRGRIRLVAEVVGMVERVEEE